ncbi:putative transcription factor interactor and regulator LisH family [Helianthus annuus]|nr:putative transcription factor interactor and regulator LisH family [Helianthus annuus]
MDVEKSSLCNCVVNFLLEENYLLSAFELLHELLDDGRHDQAIRLKEFFADPVQFPPDLISRFNTLRVADPQSLLEEKEALEEKLAIRDYESRLAQEDILKLKTELQKKSEARLDELSDAKAKNGSDVQQSRETAVSELGPLKAKERQDLNCAVKEYLLLAGYRLTAMTFYEEVSNQDLDNWQNSSASVPDALRHYYYQYLSSTTEAAEEKFSMLKKNESLVKENDKLKHERQSLLRSRDLAEAQVVTLKKSLESLQKDVKEKDKLVQDLKQSVEQRKNELTTCKAEITSLKKHAEGAQPTENMTSGEEIQLLKKEIERLNAAKSGDAQPVGSINSVEEVLDGKDEVTNICENDMLSLSTGNPSECSGSTEPQNETVQDTDGTADNNEEFPKSDDSDTKNSSKDSVVITHNGLLSPPSTPSVEPDSENKGPGTIQILSDTLPKIVPYVLINHREELLPLMMCAIERHPSSNTRDSLTHTLFNLIKRPDEQQRRIIMDACVTLARNVGEMRTETELLPQCWEQISHMYEERRLLVAQSCGELAEFVRPEIRDSLILSIVQQLLEDSAIVVREAAARNLALLLPLFPNTDKYFKVEEMMFQLVCDPSGVVVETTIRELVPALLKWGNKLDHILRVLLSHMLSSIECCPPLSGVEDSVESHFHVLGERERWTVDVLLRLLLELLPVVHQISIETCPYPPLLDSVGSSFPKPLLEKYAEGHVDWPTFEWLHDDCFPSLIQIVSLLPQKEDSLRNRISSFLLAVSKRFGDDYLTHIMLPVFLVAVGDDADLACFPSTSQPKVKALRPKNAGDERIARLCVLPLLLAGVLGSPSKHEVLTEYLRNLLVQNAELEGHLAMQNVDVYNSVRFLCLFEEHHNLVFNVIWEMVVSSNMDLKVNAAKLLKMIVPYIDAKVASAHVLPALVTLGSEPNLPVLYASIDAFGTVAQNFKADVIVDKIRVQMDAFLEDGSHEAILAVIRALVVAVPHTTESLRDYLLSKIFHLSANQLPSTNMARRRDRSNAFCEAIRALDATDLSAASVRDLLLPTIQNLLKDTEALDPAHKEALEIIVKDRSGGTFDTFSKVMGSQFALPTSMTSLFSEGGLLGKRDSVEMPPPAPPTSLAEQPKITPTPPPSAVEDTRFRRIMRGGLTDMLRGKPKNNDEPSTPH